MTATEPCVSLTTGTLSPDQRVNYAYGMVLGLDEFLQEQLYHQEKDYRHRRVLHGYGTSYGLKVCAEPTTDGTRDYTVTVSPGVGIDQWGREFVIRDAQCVRLGSWLVAQDQAHPGIVQQHGDGSGDTTVYVVASYASCLDNLVPLPGRPCSSGEQTQVASRIRDSWNVDLRWEPPPMPRWDSDRRLGRLLGSVEVVDEPDPNLPGDTALLDAVRALAGKAQDGPGDIDQPSGVIYQISKRWALRTWDQIFAIWVTEVRPQLEPDLIAPAESSDPAILLGSIQLSTGVWPPFDPNNPVVQFAEVFDQGRPCVLNTQLIQELPSPEAKAVEPIELVTLVPNLSTAGAFTIDAWFHATYPVNLIGPVPVVTEAGATWSFSVVAKGGSPDFSNVWTLTPPPGAKFTNGQQLSARFESDSVIIGAGYTLDQWRDHGSRFLNTTETGAVLAYATAAAPASTGTLAEASLSSAPVAVTPVAGAEFVTISDTGATDQQLSFELWFHPGPRGARDDMTVETPQVRAFDEITGDPLTVTGLTQDPLLGNAWTVTTDVPGGKRPFPAYVRFVFPAEGFVLADATSGTTGLADWIDSAAIGFVGWDQGESSIVAFHRVAPPGTKAAGTKAVARKATTGRSRTR
jgi:hypothetical protein